MDETDDQPGCGAALTAIGTIIINFMTGIILVPSTFHFQGSVINTDGLNYYQTEGFPEVTEFAVFDAAGVLSRESHNFFNQNSLKLKKATGGEIFVAAAPDVFGSVNDVSRQLFKALKLSSPDLDNGALILFTTEIPHVTLRVGSGLKSCITDAKAARILNKHAVPDIRKERWNTAARNTWNAVAREIYSCSGVSVPDAVMGEHGLFAEDAVKTYDNPPPPLKVTVNDTSLAISHISALVLCAEFLMLFLYLFVLSISDSARRNSDDAGG